MKAFLKNYKQSPRKVRLVTDLIRGKDVSVASEELKFVNKRASRAIKKLLDSATANAKQNDSKTENLYIKEATVNEGPTLKRFRPKWRGIAHPIRKRTSNITLTLAERAPEKKEVKKVSAKKTVKAKK